MKANVHGAAIELEPNSKPYLLKRFLADGSDIFLIFCLFLLFTMLITRMPVAKTYREHFDRYKAIEQETLSQFGNDAEAAAKALSENEEYQNERFAANLHGYLLKAAACFLAELLVLVIVPLGNKGRATPGKMLTGVLPFNERRQSVITKSQIAYRFVYVLLIDSLALYLLTGILTFLLVPVLRLTEMLSNKKNKTICDMVTGVMMIERLSYDGITRLDDK